MQRAAAMTGLPPMRQVNANDTDFEGVAKVQGGPIHNVDYYNTVTVNYVDAMKIPMASGRGFEAGDVTGGPVALVNEALAKKFYPGVDPIGRGIRSSGPDRPYARIVGVVKDLKQGGLRRGLRHRGVLPGGAGPAPVQIRAVQHEPDRALDAAVRQPSRRSCGRRSRKWTRRCRSCGCAPWRRCSRTQRSGRGSWRCC